LEHPAAEGAGEGEDEDEIEDEIEDEAGREATDGEEEETADGDGAVNFAGAPNTLLFALTDPLLTEEGADDDTAGFGAAADGEGEGEAAGAAPPTPCSSSFLPHSRHVPFFHK